MTSSRETITKRAIRKNEKFVGRDFFIFPPKTKNKGAGRPRWQERMRKGDSVNKNLGGEKRKK